MADQILECRMKVKQCQVKFLGYPFYGKKSRYCYDNDVALLLSITVLPACKNFIEAITDNWGTHL